MLAALEASGIPVRRYADGTNTVRIPAGRAARAPEAAKAQTARSGLKLPPAQGSELVLKINASWTADDPTAIAARLMALVA